MVTQMKPRTSEVSTKDELLEMYRLMYLARRFDECVVDLYAAREAHGSMHLYIGEEAVAVGACSALEKGDYITSTHRGHGHCIAKGGDPKYMMAEILGKSEGYCKGKGGSMHIAHLPLGILGANGIVGGGLPISAGSALSSQVLDTGSVTICFFGDGASNQGTFHEALNLAGVWRLPVVFLCENNGYGMTVPQREHQAIKDVAVRAAGYGMPGIVADGTDVLDVHDKVKDAVERARVGDGPTLVECKTYRYRGHWEGDPQPYRSQSEIDEWKKQDCILLFERRLIEEFGVAPGEMDKIKSGVDDQADDAVSFARTCPHPKPEEALEDVYTCVESARPVPVIVEPREKATIASGLNSTLDAILGSDSRSVVFGEDVTVLGGPWAVTRGLYEKYGQNRVRNTPISESAIIGAAIGASLTGLRPIAEIMFCDFLYAGMDQVVNQMAKMKYMYGGDAELPIVIRTTCGGGYSAAAQHSQSNEAMFMHVPGLKIVMPSTPDDAVGLLLSAYEDPNPVIFYEHKGLYDEKGEITGMRVPIGKAKVVREGSDITVVTYGIMRKLCLTAAERLSREGISLEVIDLRTLLPIDEETILNSVGKTGRLAIVHEATLTAGPGAEIAAIVVEKAFGPLRAPIKRIAGLNVPMPFSLVLENAAIPSASVIEEELRKAVR